MDVNEFVGRAFGFWIMALFGLGLIWLTKVLLNVVF